MSSAIAIPDSDEIGQLFEPIRFETLADVFAQYGADRQRMSEIAGVFGDHNRHLVSHFMSANASERSLFVAENLFLLEPAVKALDAAYWDRTLSMTDVLEAMPQARRDEWHKLVQDRKTPPFEEDTVIATLKDMLAQRHRFFAERVDGVFRGLSHEHVTNRPEGFSKRMILNYVHGGLLVNYHKSGVINDLRCVVAKFTGRDEPRSYTTTRAIEHALKEHCGEWVTMDGGALRLRVYKKGTAHIEVHPEMAWRLNVVLASIHPNAIPDIHRRRPRTAAPKDFQLYSRPLPTPVVELLMRGRMSSGGTFAIDYDARDSPAVDEAKTVLESLGGVATAAGALCFSFDYDAEPIIRDVAVSGVIPDQKAHQYYPTPTGLAQRVVDLAEIGDDHTVLEPSAGQGALATHLRAQDQWRQGWVSHPGATLVEASELHCRILRQKGFETVICRDFLSWAPGRRFDRVVMNPPFAGGRWHRHVEHAAELLAEGGRLVAILPSGAVGRKDLLSGFTCTWGDPEPFPGTSIEVVILVAERAP